MPSTNPHIRIRTRPSRSARPPATTMKMPEKRAVIDTAMFITLVVTPRSALIAGEMLSVVCAKSQNARTPKMMPKRSLSLPRYDPDCRVIVVSLLRFRLRQLFHLETVVSPGGARDTT